MEAFEEGLKKVGEELEERKSHSGEQKEHSLELDDRPGKGKESPNFSVSSLLIMKCITALLSHYFLYPNKKNH